MPNIRMNKDARKLASVMLGVILHAAHQKTGNHRSEYPNRGYCRITKAFCILSQPNPALHQTS